MPASDWSIACWRRPTTANVGVAIGWTWCDSPRAKVSSAINIIQRVEYRDWVIQAMNDDLPYDEFVRMQLAGDVLHPEDPAGLVATGYLVITPHDYLGLNQGSSAMKVNSREDELENLVGNIGQTFLGMTVNCARCHDHKFDPLTAVGILSNGGGRGGLVRSDRALPVPAAPAVGSPEQESQRRGKEIDRRVVGGIAWTRGRRVDSSGCGPRRWAAAEQAVEAARAALAEAEKAAASNDVNLRSVAEDRRRDLHSAEDALIIARNPYSARPWTSCSSACRWIAAASTTAR